MEFENIQFENADDFLEMDIELAYKYCNIPEMSKVIFGALNAKKVYLTLPCLTFTKTEKLEIPVNEKSKITKVVRKDNVEYSMSEYIIAIGVAFNYVLSDENDLFKDFNDLRYRFFQFLQVLKEKEKEIIISAIILNLEIDHKNNSHLFLLKNELKLQLLLISKENPIKKPQQNTLKGKKLNLLERYEIAKRVFDFDNKIRTLNILEAEKDLLLSLILDCNTTNARHIMNGKYAGKVREDLISDYIQDLKK